MVAFKTFSLLPLVASFATLVGAADQRTETNVHDGIHLGEPHGTAFDDFSATGSAKGQHLRIASIAMACAQNEHIYGLQVTYRDNLDDHVPIVTVDHGPMPPFGNPEHHRLDLAKNEFIIMVQMRTWRAKAGGTRRTRIGSVTVKTSTGATLTCGAFSAKDSSSRDAPDAAVLYFSGSSGDAIDYLQPHWIPKSDF